jgi:acyl carrier protein/seryl-tRNA synthetase
VLTAKELEQRLLRFTREKLAEREVADAITVDTRLFEDRVIDSLKVLELIAFLQSALRRKIPDAQIVLANFRTIATIARVFSSGDPVAITRARRNTAFAGSGKREAGSAGTNGKHEMQRVGANSVPSRSNGKSAVSEMLARRELELTPDGGLIMRGAAASLRDYFDATVCEWAIELGATEETFPAEIPLATLGRAGFTTAFPQKLMWAGRTGDESAPPPAVCYHHYPRVSDGPLEGGESVVTAIGRCYRNEFDANSAHPAERLAAFTMREIVAVGDAALVEKLRNESMGRTQRWLEELSLQGRIEVASDPFFTSEARGRMLMQQMLPLKYELRLRVDRDGRSVAAASFNNHEQHFGRAFSILLPSGEFAHSGCVAFGWERWVIAFVNQHGPDEESWPDVVRSKNVAVNV